MKEFPTCKHFSKCSGCSHSLNDTAPSIWKRIENFMQRPIPLISENSPGWRLRAKLAIRKSKDGTPALGLFERGTHTLAAIPHCQAHHPAINRAATLLAEEMRHLQIDPYDEKKQTGSLRYAQFFVCRETMRVQLTIITREKKDAKRLSERLWEADSSLWHSIWINVQTSRGNNILGPEWHHCYGELFLHQRIGRVQIAFHPASFSQAHLSLFDQLLKRVETWVKPGSKLLEIYAGAGAISLHLAPHLAFATLIEENPYSYISYQNSSPNSAFKYVQGDAKEAIAYLQDADLILLDPPRKGVDRELLSAIKEVEEKKLIYISCNFDSFERDAKELMDGGWILEDAVGYWLFPGANHIELATSWKKESG